MWRIILIILNIIIFGACKKSEPKFVNNGYVDCEGIRYNFNQARFSVDSIVDGLYCANLTFTPTLISISEDGVKGGGASYLRLSLFLPLDTLPLGTYLVNNNEIRPYLSYIATISEDKKDTSRIYIEKGSVTYSLKGDTMPMFSFDLISSKEQKLTGIYTGTMLKNRSLDADSMGYIKRDTVIIPLGIANMWKWSTLFSDEVYYHELEIVSTNTRLTDAGKIKNGNIIVLGFFSDNINFPNDGVYKVKNTPQNFALYYGHKVKNTSWGSYWNEVKNSSITARANIIGDSVSISKIDDNKIDLNINLKDQLGNAISGKYIGNIKLKTP